MNTQHQRLERLAYLAHSRGDLMVSMEKARFIIRAMSALGACVESMSWEVRNVAIYTLAHKQGWTLRMCVDVKAGSARIIVTGDARELCEPAPANEEDACGTSPRVAHLQALINAIPAYPVRTIRKEVIPVAPRRLNAREQRRVDEIIHNERRKAVQLRPGRSYRSC